MASAPSAPAARPTRPRARPASAQSAGDAAATPRDVPSVEELLGFAEYLGVRVEKYPSLSWVAVAAYFAPLPSGWSEHADAEGNGYYYHEPSDTSQREHPLDEYFTKLYVEEKAILKSEKHGRREDPVSELHAVGHQHVLQRSSGTLLPCTPLEVKRMAGTLGLQLPRDAPIAWVAREAADFVPFGWFKETDGEGATYYRHERTQLAMREHPALIHFLSKVELCKALGDPLAGKPRSIYCFATFAGPNAGTADFVWLQFDSTEGPFYFDIVHEQSILSDPRPLHSRNVVAAKIQSVMRAHIARRALLALRTDYRSKAVTGRVHEIEERAVAAVRRLAGPFEVMPVSGPREVIAVPTGTPLTNALHLVGKRAEGLQHRLRAAAQEHEVLLERDNSERCQVAQRAAEECITAMKDALDDHECKCRAAIEMARRQIKAINAPIVAALCLAAISRRQLLSARQAACKLQALFRQTAARKWLTYARMLRRIRAATCVQAVYRRYLACCLRAWIAIREPIEPTGSLLLSATTEVSELQTTEAVNQRTDEPDVESVVLDLIESVAHASELCETREGTKNHSVSLPSSTISSFQHLPTLASPKQPVSPTLYGFCDDAMLNAILDAVSEVVQDAASAAAYDTLGASPVIDDVEKGTLEMEQHAVLQDRPVEALPLPNKNASVHHLLSSLEPGSAGFPTVEDLNSGAMFMVPNKNASAHHFLSSLEPGSAGFPTVEDLNSAVAVQAVWRRWVARLKRASLDVVKQQEVVAAAWRSSMLNYEVLRSELVTREAATIIQATWRRASACIAVSLHIRAVVVIQAAVRHHAVKRRKREGILEISHPRSTPVQALRSRSLDGIYDDAARKLQSTWRGFLGRSHVHKRRGIALHTLQLRAVNALYWLYWGRAVRRWLPAATAYRTALYQHAAAICIQSCWRAANARHYVAHEVEMRTVFRRAQLKWLHSALAPEVLRLHMHHLVQQTRYLSANALVHKTSSRLGPLSNPLEPPKLDDTVEVRQTQLREQQHLLGVLAHVPFLPSMRPHLGPLGDIPTLAAAAGGTLRASRRPLSPSSSVPPIVSDTSTSHGLFLSADSLPVSSVNTGQSWSRLRHAQLPRRLGPAVIPRRAWEEGVSAVCALPPLDVRAEARRAASEWADEKYSPSRVILPLHNIHKHPRHRKTRATTGLLPPVKGAMSLG